MTVGNFEPVIQGEWSSAEVPVDAALLDQWSRLWQFSGTIRFTFHRERGGWKVIRAEGWQQKAEEGLGGP